MIKDKKIESLLTKIKESSDSNEKVSYYKKAVTRLNNLKNKYNDACDKLEKNTSKDENLDECLNINTLVSELEELETKFDGEITDMSVIVDDYLKYKKLLLNLENAIKINKNKIYKIDSSKNKIKIVKLENNSII